MYNLNSNSAPQALLDKYYELDNIRGELPQAAVQDIIVALRSSLGSVNYKEDRFETKLLNGKVLPQVHIVMKSNDMALLRQNFVYNAPQAPQVYLDHSVPQVQDNIVYCATQQASQANDDYDSGSGAKLY